VLFQRIVAATAAVFEGNVVLGAVRVDDVRIGGHELGVGRRGPAVGRVPVVGGVEVVVLPGPEALDEPRFDALSGDRELLPEFRADRERPVVLVAVVDLGSGGKVEPPRLVGAVGRAYRGWYGRTPSPSTIPPSAPTDRRKPVAASVAGGRGADESLPSPTAASVGGVFPSDASGVAPSDAASVRAASALTSGAASVGCPPEPPLEPPVPLDVPDPLEPEPLGEPPPPLPALPLEVAVAGPVAGPGSSLQPAMGAMPAMSAPIDTKSLRQRVHDQTYSISRAQCIDSPRSNARIHGSHASMRTPGM
jgi:hypothetical protein